MQHTSNVAARARSGRNQLAVLAGVALVMFAFTSMGSFAGSAAAQTWLDQRFYDEPARPNARGSYNYAPGSLTGAPRPRTAKRASGTKVAALTTDFSYAAPKKSLSGGVSWVASAGCLDGALRSVIYQVAANYGPVTVNSTCRSKSHNRRVGGAHRSKHLTGDAADFRVRGNVRAAYAFLQSHGSVGGIKHYGGGLFHIDNGQRRSW
jgi:hypothetical protein